MSNPFASFVGQCVGFVEYVLPWVEKGPATAADYIHSLPAMGAQPQTAADAQAGDVVVWKAGQDGADPTTGHIAVVTGRSSNGDVNVSQANWADNGLPSVMTIPASVAQGLTFFSPPPGHAAQSAANAVASAQGLPSAAPPTSSGSAGSAPTTGTPSSNTSCRSLSDWLTNDGGWMSGIPVIGTVEAGLSAPIHVFQWATQPCKVWKGAFFVGALAVGGVGLYLLLRKEVDAAAGDVAKVGAVAAA